jgi:hypothetical protein
MSLLSVSDLKGHIPVLQQGVTDTALGQLLDDAEQAITVYRGGPPGAALTELRRGGLRIVWSTRPIDLTADVTITELDGSSGVVLAADDWWLRANLMSLLRRPYGSHPRDTWGEYVELTYTPVDDTVERKRVQLDLCKLELAYNGYGSVATQSEQRSSLDYDSKRRAILASFAEIGWGPR